MNRKMNLTPYTFGYRDFAENFPHIFQQLKVGYYEGLESYRVPSSVLWTRNHSRTSVKSTAKKQHSLRQQHKIEMPLQYVDDSIPIESRKLLVLNFQGQKEIGYVVATNVGHIAVLWFDWCKSWMAFACDKQWRVFVQYESKISYQDALARLFSLQWGSHIITGRAYRLYDFYRGIFFYFPDHRLNKRPRNNTNKIQVSNSVSPIWAAA